MYLGGRTKAPYEFVIHKPNLDFRDSQYVYKIWEDEIWKVSSKKCCGNQCCQRFNPNQTSLVRQKFYLKSFANCRKYGIVVGKQLHNQNGDRKKIIIIERMEFCVVVWNIIHSILKLTLHSYIEKYNDGMPSSAQMLTRCPPNAWHQKRASWHYEIFTYKK